MTGRLATVAIVVSLLLLTSCDGGSGDGGGAPQLPYEIRVIQPQSNGVQIDRDFAIELRFYVPGTNTPQNVGRSESLTVGVASGPGALTGDLLRRGTGGSTLVFSGLRLDAQGSYRLQFSGSKSVGAVQTTNFTVGEQLDLRFSFTPGTALRNRPFSVSVETVDPLTQQPKAAAYPLMVTMSLNTGTGVLGGTLTETGTGGTSVVFSNLTYSEMETITLRATSFGFADVLSNPIPIDEVVMAFRTVPVTARVNGTFSVSVDLSSRMSGQPLIPQPGISATISVASGAGTLSGGTSATSSGSTLVFTLLKYNQIGIARLAVSSPEAATITTPDISFGIDLQPLTSGPTLQAPGAPWQPFLFRAIDGAGAVWTGPVGPLGWVVENSSGQPVEAGSATFNAGEAFVTPSPIPSPGGYTLRGSITQPVVRSAAIGLTVSSLALVNEPGPFAALKTVRVGMPYSDSVAFAVSSTANGYGVLSGSMPPGLSLSTTTGEITGTPTQAGSYEFSLYATLGNGDSQRIRCALAVFSSNESEVVSGQNFSAPGPHTPIGPLSGTIAFVSSYDGLSYPLPGNPQCAVEYYVPDAAQAPGRRPVFVHHRGRGFNMDDYAGLGTHLASHGIIFVSVENYDSFLDGGASGQPPNHDYDTQQPERGMLSASAFQEAVLQWVVNRGQQPGNPLHNRVHEQRIFMGGHSRGGGATQASHVRSKPWVFGGSERRNINIRGAIYLMAYDLRSFHSTAAGTPVIYPVPHNQPRLPSLIISAENDGDLAFPYCDTFIDRAAGPTTFATIYGGCHNFMSDHKAPENNANPYITRQEQQALTFHMVVAFIKRWANLDLSLEGLLYNNEYAGSDQMAVTAWRNMAGVVMVDDHQDGIHITNSLGGANTLDIGTFSNSSVYPVFGGFHTLGLRHAILTLDPAASAAYRTVIPPGSVDLTRARRLIMRMGQVSFGASDGFDWVTIRLRITDANGHHAIVTLFDRGAQNNTWLPDHPGTGSNTYDRFVEANVPLGAFAASNLAFSASLAQQIELTFETDSGSTSRQIYFDDLRFE